MFMSISDLSWLYVIIMSRTRFKVNLHNIVAWMPRNRRDIWGLNNGIRTHATDMVKTYSEMHRTDKYSQHSSIIWPVWLNGWVLVYELSGCGLESRFWS